MNARPPPAVPKPPKSAVRQPFRSRPLGLLLIVGAAVPSVAALASAAFYIFYLGADPHSGDIVLLATAVVLSLWMVKRGRKLMTRDAAEVLAEDPRPPVVYLRPFHADERQRSGMPLGVRHGGRAIHLYIAADPTEAALARELNALGPFVAIGAPGEKFATLGAARMYVGDDEWQARVDDMLARAAAVVLQPETSAGTRWEVMRVAKAIDPRRVLLIVPNPAHRPLGYARIRALIAADFPVPLPADCAAADLFMFDAAAQPVPIVLGRGTLAPFIAQVQTRARAHGGAHA